MFYVAYDPASNIVITRYDTEIAPLPDPLPSGTAVIEVPDQATMLSTTAPGWTVQNGVLVAPPPPSAAELLAQAQTAQIASLQSSFSQAEQAPISLTLASGVTTSFGMTPHDWTKIVGLYSKYVAKGVAVPSGYQIPDANGTLQTVTVTDIENLFDAGETQMTGAIAKLASLVGEVQAATTVSAVQAIVW